MFSDVLPNYTRIGDYTIQRCLGRGRLGVTYLAHHANGDRVALKEFMPHRYARRGEEGHLQPIIGSETILARYQAAFLTQVTYLQNLRHPSLATPRESLHIDGGLFMVLPHVNGEPLALRLKRRGLTPRELLNLTCDLGSALRKLHTQNILHLDLEPEHILMDLDDGIPVCIGFSGIEKQNSSEANRGISTPVVGYSALEVALGREQHIGPWSDIYSLGAILYESVAGFVPCDARVRQRYQREYGWDDPLIPAKTLGVGGYPDAFLEAIDAALILEPAARPQSVQSWLAGVQTLFKQKSLEDSHQTPLLMVLRDGDRAWLQKDHDEAQRAYSEAASHGSATALNALGWMKQVGDHADPLMAAVWYQRAATLGDVGAMYQLGHLFMDVAEALDETPDDVKRWFYQAAKRHHAPSWFQLGKMYRQGNGVAEDHKKALHCFQLAAGQGNADAQMYLGLMIREGRAKKLTLQKAGPWFELAMVQDHPQAHYQMAQLYELGRGVKKDLHRAFTLFQKAAEWGLPEAKVSLGRFLAHGLGVASNLQAAMDLLEREAELGLASAAYELALIYKEGLHGQPDGMMAEAWFLRTIELGMPQALDQLGLLYEQGLTMDGKDLARALAYYQKAADAGVGAGHFHLGRMFERGNGVDQDLGTAIECYEAALEAGESRARTPLKQLDSKVEQMTNFKAHSRRPRARLKRS
ncbi:Sel1-like repeat-containing protein kinase family protein [Magnetococcus sp. PR-3]|uniref:Sel1-like repeat-containing protein kinase family protein n=1 Tax=Magnetococcus sp. PR-3 TaxID=3120355 RepID=UPI002FCE50D3